MEKNDLIKLMLKADLCQWEKTYLSDFNGCKPLEELLEYVDEDKYDEFLVNLADGLSAYSSKLKGDIIEKEK